VGIGGGKNLENGQERAWTYNVSQIGTSTTGSRDNVVVLEIKSKWEARSGFNLGNVAKRAGGSNLPV